MEHFKLFLGVAGDPLSMMAELFGMGIGDHKMSYITNGFHVCEGKGPSLLRMSISKYYP
jgi:hypothetical protein